MRPQSMGIEHTCRGTMQPGEEVAHYDDRTQCSSKERWRHLCVFILELIWLF